MAHRPVNPWRIPAHGYARETDRQFAAPIAEVSGFAQPACPVMCKLAAIDEYGRSASCPKPMISDNMPAGPSMCQSIPTRPPVDHEPAELRTVRQPPSRIRARPWARLLDGRRELVHESRRIGIISQLKCPVLGTIFLNMFCRINNFPCAPAPV
jgi:hypothetical protein